MIWRLVLIVSLVAMLAGAAVHFYEPLFALFKQAPSLDKEQVEKLNAWREFLAGGVAGLGALGLACWKFIRGKAEEKTKGQGNQAVFHGKVSIGGDFVQGDKNIGGKGDV